jgi:hypothetical protein
MNRSASRQFRDDERHFLRHQDRNEGDIARQAGSSALGWKATARPSSPRDTPLMRVGRVSGTGSDGTEVVAVTKRPRAFPG